MSKLGLLKKQLTFGCFDDGCSYCVEQCLVFHEGPQTTVGDYSLRGKLCTHCNFLDNLSYPYFIILDCKFPIFVIHLGSNKVYFP